MSVPAVIVAGEGSGCGKTTVALAIMAALSRRGLHVQPFKTGPDFLDPGHHQRIMGRIGRNLDTWLQTPDVLARTFLRGAAGADFAVIEGVMGLFDGAGGGEAAGSTADLARSLDLPVALVVDGRGVARSIAPLIHGFKTFDRSVDVAAVVVNRVGSHRHYTRYLEPAIGEVPGVRALGYLARDANLAIPSRHLGLRSAIEFDQPADSSRFDRLADAAEATIDIDALVALARAPKLADPARPLPIEPDRRFRVAIAYDRAFQFYYEDNLDDLREEGAEIVRFSPLDEAAIPERVDLLYLGGGYPELYGEVIARNVAMRESIRRFHAQGGAILAECGGMMACCRAIEDADGRRYDGWGLIPATIVMRKRFVALGYVTIETAAESLFGARGTTLRGHEFHYSTLVSDHADAVPFVFNLLHSGDAPKPDGFRIDGLLAGYAHAYFGSNPLVSGAIARFAGARNSISM